MPNFKVGLRTLKTAISVAICLTISRVVLRDSPVIMCLAAVYSLRKDTSSSFTFSVHRFIGTSIGVFVSMAGILAQQHFSRHIAVDALIAFFGVIGVIVLCNGTKHPEGIITSISTLLFICFNTPTTETLSYALLRLIDVLIGASVAIMIDFLLPSHHLKKKKLSQLFNKKS